MVFHLTCAEEELLVYSCFNKGGSDEVACDSLYDWTQATYYRRKIVTWVGDTYPLSGVDCLTVISFVLSSLCGWSQRNCRACMVRVQVERVVDLKPMK